MSFASIQNLVPSGPDVMVAQHGNDNGLHVQFYDEAVLQSFESEAAGRPIYKPVPYIHMLLPGGKSDIKRPVKLEDDGRSPPDTVRFPRQWAAYKTNTEQLQSGTPLEAWPAVNKAQIFELKAQRIHTVEQLDALPDSALHTLGMMGRELREKAHKFLSAASDNGAIVSALEAKNEALQVKSEALEAKNAAFEADLEKLKAQFAELATLQPKRRAPAKRRAPKQENDNDQV